MAGLGAVFRNLMIHVLSKIQLFALARQLTLNSSV